MHTNTSWSWRKFFYAAKFTWTPTRFQNSSGANQGTDSAQPTPLKAVVISQRHFNKRCATNCEPYRSLAHWMYTCGQVYVAATDLYRTVWFEGIGTVVLGNFILSLRDQLEDWQNPLVGNVLRTGHFRLGHSLLHTAPQAFSSQFFVFRGHIISLVVRSTAIVTRNQLSSCFFWSLGFFAPHFLDQTVKMNTPIKKN